MPTYEYECQTCGPFTARRPMAQFRDPCTCPECGAGAPRAFLCAPAMARGNPGRRLAYAAPELNPAHPRRSSSDHPAGCGCCMRRTLIPSALASTGRVFSSSGPLPRNGR